MPTRDKIETIRNDYRLHSLMKEDVSSNPILQFQKWWKDALECKIVEPNAMTLATCDPQGKPSARIVLLKGIREDGFVFYTNYESRKGREIENNRFVALVLLWKEIERQVRIEGEAHKINPNESDAYFSTRPRESCIGAWSSPQSKVIDDRSILEQNFDYYNKEFKSGNIPRPENWGGYIVRPTLIEFWQGRTGRLHDRLQYTVDEQSNWKIVRLAP